MVPVPQAAGQGQKVDAAGALARVGRKEILRRWLRAADSRISVSF